MRKTSSKRGANSLAITVALGGTDAVAMRKQVLEIGTSRIDVAYELVNGTDVLVTLTMVFPLPEYGGLTEPDDDFRGEQPANFSLLIDGLASPFANHVSARFKADDSTALVDVTAVLRETGLDDAQIALLPGPFKISGRDISAFDPAQSRQASAVTRGQVDALRARGLLREDPHLRESDTLSYPAWRVRIVYAWTLTFPPGKTVSVRHSYAPFLGSGITQSWIPDDRAFSAKVLRDEFCASPGLIHRLERSAPRDAAPLWGGTGSYILKTANTWRGPIRDFTLRLRKSSLEESISLCFPGQFKKVDALTLEAKIADLRLPRTCGYAFWQPEARARSCPKRIPMRPSFGAPHPRDCGIAQTEGALRQGVDPGLKLASPLPVVIVKAVPLARDRVVVKGAAVDVDGASFEFQNESPIAMMKGAVTYRA